MIPSHLLRYRTCVFLTLAFLMMRCGRSDLSTGSVTDPALIQVTIEVHRRVCYDGNSSSIKAFLKDGAGKTIANKAIQIRVNGKPMRLNNGSSNYYGAFPYYELLADSPETVLGGATYAFSMVLTDGNEYNIGRIQTQPDLTSQQILLPPSHSRKQPLAVQWQQVEPGNFWTAFQKRWQGETSHSQLTISKVNEKKDKWGNDIQDESSANEADYLTVEVGRGSDSYTIPITYFQQPLADFNALSLLLTSIRTVKPDGTFRTGSAITSEHSTFYKVKITD
ncbi:hypothetical protein WBJ53_04465 [Spirosoma sp. SC4-14]|uniref:hypothetical protein n=1 Tax=Spirosoma sp. SC4-14 TaxID=3128900 RepID=UPI0030CCCECA